MDGLVVAIDTSTGEYYSLNQTASIIWQSIAGQRKLEDIHKELAAEYQVEGLEVEQEIKACINEWLSFGIMQQVDAT